MQSVCRRLRQEEQLDGWYLLHTFSAVALAIEYWEIGGMSEFSSMDAAT